MPLITSKEFEKIKLMHSTIHAKKFKIIENTRFHPRNFLFVLLFDQYDKISCQGFPSYHSFTCFSSCISARINHIWLGWAVPSGNCTNHFSLIDRSWYRVKANPFYLRPQESNWRNFTLKNQVCKQLETKSDLLRFYLNTYNHHQKKINRANKHLF